MTYGIKVWDQYGELGTESEDVLALALFADTMTYVAPTAPLFLYNQVVLEDVEDRPRLCMWLSNFNGSWNIMAGGDTVYDSGAKTLTVKNTVSSQASTFFLILSW